MCEASMVAVPNEQSKILTSSLFSYASTTAELNDPRNLLGTYLDISTGPGVYKHFQ